MWRSTEDGLYPFTGVTNNLTLVSNEPKAAEKLKDFEFEPTDQYFSEIVRAQSDKFKVNQCLYSIQKDCYVTVISIKDENLECRPRENDSDVIEMQKTLSFNARELTELIKIAVVVDSDEEAIVSYFEVNIQDNILECLLDLLSGIGLGGQILFQGSLIGSSDTFQGKFVKMNDKLLLNPQKSQGRVDPIYWVGFKRIARGGGWKLEGICATKFYANVNLTVYGFLWTQDTKDFTISLKFQVNEGSEFGEYQIEGKKDEVKESKIENYKLHFFDFQDLGIPSVHLNEGDYIQIQVTCPTSGQRFDLAHSRGQPAGILPHFRTEVGDKNTADYNCSDHSYLPGLLYMPDSKSDLVGYSETQESQSDGGGGGGGEE